MIKTIKVSIDKTTWPAAGAPSFPANFHAGEKIFDLNINEMLLLVGHLTTPTLASGVSLSELWACVRYYYAMTASPDLRLTSAFAQLDSHQKTILSDDFGMGIPVRWLIEPLKLAAWSDGREFATRFCALTLAPPPKLNKNGPAKSPDFVFQDEAGLYHVVECKGTQSGRATRNRQLSHLNKVKQPSGAVVQKTMIKLQSHIAGQRLACGVAIAHDNSADTQLLIQDPDGEITIEVKKGEEPYAQDAVVRATTARALRAAGLSRVAARMAAPNGADAGARPLGKGKREQARVALMEERFGSAISEIDAVLDGRSSTAEAHGGWVTRRSRVTLPRPLTIDGKIFRGVAVEEAVSADVLKHLRDGGLENGVIANVADWLPDELGRLKLTSDEDNAKLSLGRLFRSSLQLLQTTD